MIFDANTLSTGQAGRRKIITRHRLGVLLNSARVQLIGALLFGVLGASLLRRFYFSEWSDTSFDATTTGTSLAVLIGLLIYRKVTSLPGTAALLNTVPAFTVSYLAVAALFFALRIDFSRFEFGFSFGLVVIFIFLLAAVAVRVSRPSFAFVAGGRADELLRIRFANWLRVETPEDVRDIPDLPLVADLNSGNMSPEWERCIAEEAISGRRIFNARQLKESLLGRVEIEHLSENSFGHLAPDSIYAPMKHYIDFVVALTALIVLMPLLLATALLIRLESHGPAIFRQKRMGYGGRPFTIYKFRSMRVEEEGASLNGDMTRSDDDRITRVGRLIRKTRVDELPQILNVLRGDMSWIGPRPETLRLSAWYEQEIPFYRYRHIVRPGLTGWAQVKQGHVTSVEDVNAKLQYDFFYVKKFSLWLDILIVIQTIRVVLTGHGAK